MPKTRDLGKPIVPPSSNGEKPEADVSNEFRDDPWNRPLSQLPQFKSIRVKETLTLPLKSIKYEGEILFYATSDMYQLELQTKGRGADMDAATVCNGWNMTTKEEICLVCNTMIKSAFQKGDRSPKDRLFLIRDQDIQGDKAYRHVEVVEMEAEPE